MRTRFPIAAIISIMLLFSVASCSEKTEVFNTDAISDYLPTVVGKYITYRVDSTVFTNLGRNIEIHKYQVRHKVDAEIPDNLGRPSYRIIKEIRDENGTEPWAENGTYFITPLETQVEVIEDNLRVVKLHQPFRENYKWKGNKYLGIEPYNPRYMFDNDDNMDDWDFSYDDFDETITINGQNYSNVFTVFHVNDILNAPVTNPNSYGTKTTSLERYSKGVGLVYRDYFLWEYQPPVNNISGYYSGFGVTMWMIDHN